MSNLSEKWMAALGVVWLALAGVALAVLPHVRNGWRSGDMHYAADGDQLLYMAWSREAVLHGVWRLDDAVHRESGPMMHPWTLFVPPALLAHALGLGLRGLEVIWRVLGGAGVALGLYMATRSLTTDRRIALGLAALLLFDPGLLFGQPLVRGPAILLAMAKGGDGFFADAAMVMAHLRVVPPALAYPFLLAHYGLILRARATGSKRATGGAAVCFGLLFYVYFYFWSATLAGLALGLVLDPKGRRLYATVLGVGLAIGFPAVLAGTLVKRSTPPDWLLRTDKFVRIGRYEDLLVPKLPNILWLACAPWVFARRRDLTYLWCVTGAAFVCMNQQVVTRLQVENFHWVMAVGPPLSLLLAGLAVPLIFERGSGERPRLAFLAVVVVAQVGLGFFLRRDEATRTVQTQRWAVVYDRLKADGWPIPSGAVLAGDADGVMMSAALGEVYPLAGKFVEYCSGVTDAELDERLMLNLYLSGLDRKAARREVDQPPGTLSWEAAATRSESRAREQHARRLSLIDRIWDDPATPSARFGLTHVLLPARERSPEPALAAVGPARLAYLGRWWQVWEVSPRARLK